MKHLNYILILFIFWACEISNITDLKIEAHPLVSIPFAKYTVQYDQITAQLPDVNVFYSRNNYTIEEYIDIEGADLSDFEISTLFAYSENHFPFGISFSVQFVTSKDSSERILISEIEASSNFATQTNNELIQISPELLKSIQSAKGINTYIEIDSISSEMISGLNDDNYAKLNLGIQSVVHINDTISIRNSNP